MKTGGGGCGFDFMCVPFSKTKPASPAAAPYEKCALTMIEPKKPGSDEQRTGEFSPDGTKQQLGETKGDCCYKFQRMHCGGGRPLRGDDGPLVAPMIRRDDWSSAAAPLASPDDALASRWLREASFEHASVASFARAALQLLALGAPPDLVAGVSRAALDEIAHAQTFLALAARRGAGERGPGALAVDRAPLATAFDAFVVDTFLDGCLAETVSGIAIRTAADEDGDDVERRALATIADDEERHAELAWRMLAWALRAGGPSARAALEETIRRTADEDVVVRDVVLPCARALLAATASVAATVSAHGDRSDPRA